MSVTNFPSRIYDVYVSLTSIYYHSCADMEKHTVARLVGAPPGYGKSMSLIRPRYDALADHFSYLFLSFF